MTDKKAQYKGICPMLRYCSDFGIECPEDFETCYFFKTKLERCLTRSQSSKNDIKQKEYENND